MRIIYETLIAGHLEYFLNPDKDGAPYALPPVLQAQHYEVKVIPMGDLTFAGEVNAELSAETGASVVVLHSNGLVYDLDKVRVEVNGVQAKVS